MTLTDVLDTFVYPAVDKLVSATESSDTGGTYTITNSSTAASNYTNISTTAVFTNTIADTGEYSAAGIPEIARKNGAYMIDINLEDTVSTHLFDEKIYKPSSTALMELFSEN